MEHLIFLISIFLPALMGVVFYLLDKGKFGKLPYKTRQIVIGAAFGMIAVLVTNMGLKGTVSINVRDAAPIAAALLFGGPAGIIAGALGGAARIAVSLIWGLGSFSGIASSICTLLAGIIGAYMRLFIDSKRRSALLYASLTAILVKTIHMMLIFLFQIENFSEAFLVVKHRLVGMMTTNLISVIAATLIVVLLENGKAGFIIFHNNKNRKISEIIQKSLLLYTAAAFFLSGIFIYVVQHRISIESTESLLERSLLDIQNSQIWSEASFAAQYTTWLVKDLEAKSNGDLLPDEEYIKDRIEEYSAQELYITDPEGNILYDTTLGLTHLNDNERTAKIAKYLNTPDDVIILGYKESLGDKNKKLSYVCHGLSNGGLLLAGYGDDVLLDMVNYPITFLVSNRRVGNDGFSIVCELDNTIICSGYEENLYERKLEDIGLSLEGIEPNTMFRATVCGIDCYCMYSSMLDGAENEYISISLLPTGEAFFHLDLTLFTISFIGLMIFSLLFAQIYYNIKKLLVNNIQKVNETLRQIASGNLDAVMDVRGNEEFNLLSNDINTTVDALKRLIAKEAARIDADLANAKTIQQAALPSVFPDRDEYALMASMDAAKEVGGDFYDFYMLDNTLVFLVADVSDKGIPAALFMMTAKTMIKNHIIECEDLAEAITKVNIELCDNNTAKMFITAWIGMLDITSGKLRFVNAGHNPPILKRQGGSFEYLRTRPNFVLAGMKRAKYRLQELDLEPGDEIFLYTDGVTEALDSSRNLYGEQRLIDLFNSDKLRGKSQKELLEFIRQDISSFAGEAQQADDITMLTMRFKKKVEDEWLKLL